MAAQRGAQGLDVDDFDLVLGTQWAARSRTLNPRHSGPAALAVALLLGAVRDAGLVRSHRTRRTAAQTALARRYLTGGTDGSEPVPLATACGLLGLDTAVVARAARAKLEG